VLPTLHLKSRKFVLLAPLCVVEGEISGSPMVAWTAATSRYYSVSL
jgi:hypothetical protein